MHYGTAASGKTIPATGRSHIPNKTSYNANKGFYCEIICDRSVSGAIQAFDRQDSKDTRW